MEILRKDCELIEVVYDKENEKGRETDRATLTFLDVENGEVLDVRFNRLKYNTDTSKFERSEEKEALVEEWCQEYFGKPYDELSNAVGEKRDIYSYDKFNSLWESKQTSKFTVEDRGKFFQSAISRVEDDGIAIHVYFDHKGEEYETKFTYATYVQERREWFVNPQKKNSQYDRFKKTFGVDVDDSDAIIGKPINVEVKVAFNKFAYCEIKQPDWD